MYKTDLSLVYLFLTLFIALFFIFEDPELYLWPFCAAFLLFIVLRMMFFIMGESAFSMSSKKD